MEKKGRLRIAILIAVSALAGLIAGVPFAPAAAASEQAAFLGVYPDDLDEDDREALDFKGEGVLLEDVVAEGPAERAGLKSGDIVTRLDDTPVASASALRDYISNLKPGDKVRITYVRDGTQSVATVTLGKTPDEPVWTKVFGPKVFTRRYEIRGGYLGVQSHTLTESLAKFFGVKSGVLVEEVSDGSPAEKAGIQVGDIIVSVDGEGVESSSDLREIVSSREPGDEVTVKLVRQGKEVSVRAKLEERRIHSGIRSDEDFDWDWQGVPFDWGEIRRLVREAMKEAKQQRQSETEELRRAVKELREEVEKLKAKR